MHPKNHFGLLLLLIFVSSAFTKNFTPGPETFKKEQIVRSLNILRAAHKQPALGFEGIFRQPQKITLNKGAGGGAISGSLVGIEDLDMHSLSVLAWQNDSISIDETGVNTAYFGEIDPNGRYTISDMVPGAYYVMVTADNYMQLYYNNVSDFNLASTVRVVAGEVTDGIDFIMERFQSGQASLSGTVLSQDNHRPIAHAYVNIYSMDNSYYYGWAETAEDGSYAIRGLQSGKYYAYVWAEGYLEEYYLEAESFEQATAIDIVEPQHYSAVNFTLSRGGMISGVVTTESGRALAGIYVQANNDYRNNMNDLWPDPVDGGIYGYGMAVTNADGSYLISGLPRGNYLVSAQIWDEWFYLQEYYDNVSDMNEATTVAVETEMVTAGINFDLDIPFHFGSVFGRVLDADSQPIADALVQLHAPFDSYEGGLQVWAYGYSDQRGNYRIDNLPDGAYLASAYAQVGWQYVTRYWPDADNEGQAEPLIVEGSHEPAATNFTLPVRPGSASISGQVRLNTGDPVAYGYIQLTSYNNNNNPNSSSIWAYASTDSNGRYRIDHLPPGEYAVYSQYWQNENFAQQWFDHQDSRSEANPVVLTTGEQRSAVDFDLTARPYYGAIAGTISNETDGTPIGRAYIEITPIDYNYYENGLDRLSFWPGFAWPYHAIADEQGHYQVDWLAQGAYYVSVYSDGAFEYYQKAPSAETAQKVIVSGGETLAVNFSLTARDEGNGIISGSVSAEWDSSALSIAIVQARPVSASTDRPQTDNFFNTITQKDGSYQLSGLPAGDYKLFSFSPGYIGMYYDNVYDPAEAQIITVDEAQPLTPIDFILSPILWMSGCPECDFVGPEQSAGGQVFGKVSDGNDQLIDNASIYLLDDSGKPVSFDQSNAEGMYELRGVPPGRYRIKATHQNFRAEFNNDVTDFAEAQVVEVGNGILEINFVLDSVSDGPDEPKQPETIVLYGNYPNPFNPRTSIQFSLPADMLIRLRIFNLLGQQIRALDRGYLPRGDHSIDWDGRDVNGAVMPSGIYFYTLESAGKVQAAQKMLLLK